MTKPAKKSWDAIATRDLRGAIARQDVLALGRALAKNANPNDQKRLNPWSAPQTPLLQAASAGFAAGIPMLVKAHAKRRTAGSQSMSAFTAAVQGDQPQAFAALCNTFGAMTSMEVLDCCVAIRNIRGADAERKKEAWTDRMVEALDRHPVRLAPAVAAAITMQFLGGESLPDPVQPHLVQKLMERGVLTPALVSRATDATGLVEWGSLLSKRKRPADNENEALAVELLHALKFPFEACVQATVDGDVERWLAEQAVRAQADRIDAATAPTAPRAAQRHRL